MGNNKNRPFSDTDYNQLLKQKESEIKLLQAKLDSLTVKQEKQTDVEAEMVATSAQIVDAKMIIKPAAFVSKEKLKSETLVERLNWWYNDASATNKVLANIIYVVVIAGITAGVYFGLFNETLLVQIGDQLGGVFKDIVTVIVFLLGILSQILTMKKPAEKKS